MDTNFLKTCCRVCLEPEPIMLYVYDKVDEFEMTLAEMLTTCGNLAIESSDEYSKLICKDCTEELLMVAKFREKCKTSEETLSRFAASLNQDQSEFFNDNEAVPEEGVCEDLIAPNYEESDPQAEMELFEYAEVESIEPEMQDKDDSLGLPALDDIAEDNENEPLEGEQTYHELEPFSVIAETNSNDEHEDMYKCIIEETLHPENFETTELEENTPKPFIETHSDVISDIYPVSLDLGVKVNFNCDFCGAGFMHLNNLNKHLLTHQDSSQLFECKVCTMVFTCSVDYCNHIKTHTLQEDMPMLDLPVVDTLKRIGRRVGKPKTHPSQKLKRKDHTCPHCDKIFVSKSLLDTHVRTHTGERPFECSQCDKSFVTRGGLDLHIRRHMGVKPYQCEICEKRFVETSNLRVHMRIHTGEKPHKCNRCSRSFSRVFLLQIHQRTHTGERPYTCLECNKSFAQQGDLAAHRRIHTGERPHQCEVCGKGFIKSSALTGHMRRHDKNHVLLNKDMDEQDAWSEDHSNKVENDEMIIEFDQEFE